MSSEWCERVDPSGPTAWFDMERWRMCTDVDA
jgi:hypothetical protein